MASQQTHGIITLGLLVVFHLFRKITGWEFFSGILFGVGIDFLDHFWSKDYNKDFMRRLKKGYGPPLPAAGSPICWLHLWPGFLAACAWGVISAYLFPQFRLYLPFVFWFFHRQIDRFQRQEEFDYHYHFLWPFIKKRFSHKWGYPPKPAAEFFFNGMVWMVIGFVLLGMVFF